MTETVYQYCCEAALEDPEEDKALATGSIKP